MAYDRPTKLAGAVAVAIGAGMAWAAAPLWPADTFRSAGPAPPYTVERGRGVSSGTPRVDGGAIQSAAPFVYTADVPSDGNYRVTLVLGGPRPSRTTVRVELRRLMLYQVAVPAGGRRRFDIIVNVRTPDIVGGGRVDLKAPRETVQEAIAWDRRITLEFDGDAPAVRSIAVAPVVVPTIYLLGDSTVTDQPAEPYTSWGQMLPAFLKPQVAVANHSQSGETISSAVGRRRTDKILSLLSPGDTLLVQFGHNDQKEAVRDATAPDLFRARLTRLVRAAQAKKATVVLLTPVSRHTFENGHVVDSFGRYPDITRAVAANTNAPLIDLNRSSARLYGALGDAGSWALFKHEADGSGRDATHHSAYGGWEVAKLVALGLREQHVPAARFLRPGFAFDPDHPDPLAGFTLPRTLSFTGERPWGS